MTDRRLGIVLLAGAVIAGLCWQRARTNQPYDYEAQYQAAFAVMPAPKIEGLNEHNQMFRLSAYLGRHQVIVIFFDGALGATRCPDLIELRDRAEELNRRGVKVVAVSQAIPQVNRDAQLMMGEVPGVMISDVDGVIPHQGGRLTKSGEPLTGLFLVDRKGSVAFTEGQPRPYATLDELWKELH